MPPLSGVQHLQGADASTSTLHWGHGVLVVLLCAKMSEMEIVCDASDADELHPWNLLQHRQEREVEPAWDNSIKENEYSCS